MPKGVPNKPRDAGGSLAAAAELRIQLSNLTRLEDPANESPTAVVYREMLASADAAALVAAQTGHRYGDQR